MSSRTRLLRAVVHARAYTLSLAYLAIGVTVMVCYVLAAGVSIRSVVGRDAGDVQRLLR